MDKSIVIREGQTGDEEYCVQSIMQSELGTRCFGTVDMAQRLVEDGLAYGEIYVAQNLNDEFLGFIRSAPKGMFNLFPYLHCIAIRKEFCGTGVGSALLDYFETTGFEKANKLFLTVSHFNRGAQRLYKSRGFKEFGYIENMYKEGIHEHIMMKRL